jgi:hypothetical protein
MINLSQLIEQIEDEGGFDQSVNSPNLSYLSGATRLIGGEMLPERDVQSNSYIENNLRINNARVAQDAGRYTPPQKDGGLQMKSARITLSEQDVAISIPPETAETLQDLLNREQSPEAIARAIGLFNSFISEPLSLKREEKRMSWLVNGEIYVTGANGFTETLSEDTSDLDSDREKTSSEADFMAGNATNPENVVKEIRERANYLRDKGFPVSRIAMPHNVAQALVDNLADSYGVKYLNNADKSYSGQQIPQETLMLNLFSVIGLPEPIVSQGGYFNSAGQFVDFFSDNSGNLQNKILFIGQTPRSIAQASPSVQRSDIFPDAPQLGYTAIGKPTGRTSPGVASSVYVEGANTKLSTVVMEGWQTTHPVMLEPSALAKLVLQ